MKCWKFSYQRRLPLFLHGSLSSEWVCKIEDHLAECEECRDRLARVLEGSRLAKDLPRILPSDQIWRKIEARLQSGGTVQRHAPSRAAALASAAAALVLVLFFVVRLSMPNAGVHKYNTRFDPSRYRAITLSQFANSEEPHVVTEGYVSDIQVDHEEGDLMFKLVDDLNRPNHFVVCEIVAPINLNIPAPGSRIRVYGVSRYDGQADHQWYEVHPVLSIESAQ